METGNRLLIVVIAIIVLATLFVAYSLEMHGKPGGAFITLAVSAMSTLTPSALKQAQSLLTPDAGAETKPADEVKP